jgi:TrpR-related protein YerC/YecD
MRNVGEIMNSKIKNDHTDNLFKAILTLENIEDCYDFFEDLCTISEIKAMAQRLEVAKMLKENHVYTDIEEKTGASSATISRVNRCLQYGSDGYQKVLKRLQL